MVCGKENNTWMDLQFFPYPSIPKLSYPFVKAKEKTYFFGWERKEEMKGGCGEKRCFLGSSLRDLLTTNNPPTGLLK